VRRAGRIVLCAALAFAACGATFAVPRDALAAGHEEINLAIGETKTLSAGGVKEYSEGVKGIVDVVPTPDGKTFVLTGRKDGSTTLLLIRNDGSQTVYDISVAKKNPLLVEKEVQELLKDTVGVKTRRVGSRIFIEGGVSTEQDLTRVTQIAALYQGQVESLVTKGYVSDRKLLIRLDFFFVQYERTSGYNVGVGWPTTIGGLNQANQPVFQNQYNYDFIGRTTTAANASIVNQPLPRLDIAARHGWAKVVKQSSVITANGSEANFQNGGETNVAIINPQTGAGALFPIKFGVNMTVTPRFDANTKDIDIKIGADVADLTAPQVDRGPPGRTTATITTNVTLKLGQALILSGVKTASARHEVAGLPGLSEIPVLGILFGSHSNEKQETEGAVFIVPSVVDTVPKSALELINNAMSTYKEFSGELEYVDTYPKTPPSAK
jgi:pilus assembly protein CpaC